jgi:16S rRNA processing protein RimM
MDKLAIGVVRRPHGVRGLMRVKSLSGEYAHFFNLEKVGLYKNGREIEFPVETCRQSGAELLIKLAGIDNPEEAKKYSSWEIRVDRELACPLREGQFYISDLCGCGLFIREAKVGTIRSVIEIANNDMLEIVDAEGRSFLVPFVKEHVGNVDIEKKSVELLSECFLP